MILWISREPLPKEARRLAAVYARIAREERELAAIDRVAHGFSGFMRRSQRRKPGVKAVLVCLHLQANRIHERLAVLGVVARRLAGRVHRLPDRTEF
jgi:hypothetical protein